MEFLKRQILKILNPDKYYLIAFAIILFPLLTFYYSIKSLPFYSLIEFDIFITISFPITISILIDSIFKKKTFKYSIILFIQVVFLILFHGYFIKDFQKNKTYKSGELIVQYLNEYKKTYNCFPLNLEELESKMKVKLPKSSIAFMNFPFFYKRNELGFELGFASYRGFECYYIGFLNVDNSLWHCAD